MADQPPDPADILALMEAHVQGIALPSWPVYGLASPDRAGFLSGVGEGPDGVTSIRLDYRPPGGPQRVSVQTTCADSVDLDAVLAALEHDEGQPLPLGDPSAGVGGEEAQVMVDGSPVHASVRRSAGVTVWAVFLDPVVVLVVAADIVLADHRLRRVDDLGPFKRARSGVVAEALRQRDEG